ncbi:UNVERIFIED_CONTAM: hypothetical protein GTU68_042757 [Idotea baltica]|nr:hypothetical protein [Idotea baltica]
MRLQGRLNHLFAPLVMALMALRLFRDILI